MLSADTDRTYRDGSLGPHPSTLGFGVIVFAQLDDYAVNELATIHNIEPALRHNYKPPL